MVIDITIRKTEVWEEVAKIASYTGDKQSDADPSAYERVMITDDDQDTLSRFWMEAIDVATEQLKEFVVAAATNEDCKLQLNVSTEYNTTFNSRIESTLTSYFISAIIGRWFILSNKADAEMYFEKAIGNIASVLRMLYSRKSPTRPIKHKQEE